MKKRLLLFLCIFTLLLSTAAQAEDMAAADTSVPAPSAEKADTLSPFARTRSYDGRFTDVDASAWYHDAVAALYEYGLTEGVSSSAYAPEGSVTIAELVTFAARLHALERGAAQRERGELLAQIIARRDTKVFNGIGRGAVLPHRADLLALGRGAMVQDIAAHGYKLLISFAH